MEAYLQRVLHGASSGCEKQGGVLGGESRVWRECRIERVHHTAVSFFVRVPVGVSGDRG